MYMYCRIFGKKKQPTASVKYSTYVHTKVCIQYAANIYLSSCLLSVYCLFIVCCLLFLMMLLLLLLYCCCWWRCWCRCCWWGAYTTRSKSECSRRNWTLSTCWIFQVPSLYVYVFINDDIENTATGDFSWQSFSRIRITTIRGSTGFFSGEFLCFSIPHLGLEDWEFLSSAFFVAKAPPRCLLPQPGKSWEAVKLMSNVDQDY